MTALTDRLGIRLPIVQAPMAGVSTPALAAAVSNAGGLGSVALGASTPATAAEAITATRATTNRPFAVNLFCHAPPRRDAARETAWIEALAPDFAAVGATPPATLTEIYPSFVADDAMLALLLAERPAVVSFHFGLPPADRVRALKAAGAILIGTATNLDEARWLVAGGVDAVVAQGYEAGGHRGTFDPDAPDPGLSTAALVQLLAARSSVPVIAAGGIMTGGGVAAMLALGAEAAQLGTAFIACPESLADERFRAALTGAAGHGTVMTRAVSGRPARGLPTALTALATRFGEDAAPAYPIAYDATRRLAAAATAAGASDHAVRWAGQGAPLARALPAGELVATLVRELADVRRLPGEAGAATPRC